jgi:hypothetical protein
VDTDRKKPAYRVDTDEEKPADRVDTVRMRPADRVDTFGRRSDWEGGGVGSWGGGGGGDGGNGYNEGRFVKNQRRRRRAIVEAGLGRAEIRVTFCCKIDAEKELCTGAVAFDAEAGVQFGEDRLLLYVIVNASTGYEAWSPVYRL